MKLITRDTDYAIRALSYIAKKRNKIISVGELSGELAIPRPFLRKILQVLNKKKILKSSKGSGGGFILSVPADRILLLDLIKVFQGEFKLSECLLKRAACPNIDICVLKKRINKLEKHIENELRAVSISDL